MGRYFCGSLSHETSLRSPMISEIGAWMRHAATDVCWRSIAAIFRQPAVHLTGFLFRQIVAAHVIERTMPAGKRRATRCNPGW